MPHAKLANKIRERAIDGKIPKIAPGKISPKGYHGRLSEQRMQEIIKSLMGFTFPLEVIIILFSQKMEILSF